MAQSKIEGVVAVGPRAVVGGVCFVEAEQEARETNATMALKMRIPPSVKAVGGRAEVCVPQLRSIVWSRGSTKSGEVIARAVSVQVCAAAGGQRRTPSRRSATMSSG